MAEGWCNKFRPQSLEKLTPGQKEVSEKMRSAFQADPCSTVLLRGRNGTGKTTLVRFVLSSLLDFKVKFYDSVTFKKDRICDEFVHLNNNNIVSKILSSSWTPSRWVALVVDNYDTVSLSNEKSIIDELVAFNVRERRFPLVLVVNVDHKVEFKLPTFHLDPPTEEEHSALLLNVCGAEGLKLPSRFLAEVVSRSSGDVRWSVGILQDVHMLFGDCPAPSDLESYFTKHSEYKKRDLTVFDAYRELVTTHPTIRSVLDIYQGDKVLLPLTVHENIHKEIFARKKNPQERLALMAAVNECVSKGDVIETQIYSDQVWQLQNAHCFTSCVKPLFLLGKRTRLGEVKYTISFSSELNKTSLKNINRKNILNLQNSLRLDVCNVHYISSCLNHLVAAGEPTLRRDVQTLMELFSPSTDMLKTVETCLKVDKCNTETKQLPSRIKKLLG